MEDRLAVELKRAEVEVGRAEERLVRGGGMVGGFEVFVRLCKIQACRPA